MRQRPATLRAETFAVVERELVTFVQVERLLRQLQPEPRRFMERFYGDGADCSEIAAELGLSVQKLGRWRRVIVEAVAERLRYW